MRGLRRPSGRLRGALLGGVVGGTLGLGLFLLAFAWREGRHHPVEQALFLAVVGGGCGLPIGAVVAAPRGRVHTHDAAQRALRLRSLAMALLLALGVAAPLVCFLLGGPQREALAAAVGAVSPLGLGGASAGVVLAGSINAALAVAFAAALVARPARPALGLPARLGTAAAGLSAGFFGPLELAFALLR